MLHTNETYEDRVVAFIDIQGFSNDVSLSHSDPALFQKIKQILGNLKKNEDKSLKKDFFQRLDKYPHEIRDRFCDGFEFTAVSDSFVMSYPAFPEAFELLCLELAMIQWDFLWKWNYLLRGYVSRGPCYHKGAFFSVRGIPMHTKVARKIQLTLCPIFCFKISL